VSLRLAWTNSEILPQKKKKKTKPNQTKNKKTRKPKPKEVFTMHLHCGKRIEFVQNIYGLLGCVLFLVG
jgi:hypothetical protein